MIAAPVIDLIWFYMRMWDIIYVYLEILGIEFSGTAPSTG
jgi:hypothetical protein